jgi:5-methylcytosine-specific restriction endonuclease McrA
MTKYWLGKHRMEGSKPPSRKGIPNSFEQKIKISKKLKGIKRSEITKERMSKARKGKLINFIPWNKGLFGYNSGEKHPRWKGITPINKLLRKTAQWQIWRNLVFLRDNFTCQNPSCKFCHNKIGIFLHPHHIKPLSLYPDLVYDINNGITYCAEFHLKSGLHKKMEEMNLNRLNSENSFLGGKNYNGTKSMV